MDAKGQIIDNTPIYYKDKEARDLLGDETLETEAQTCTGGINELKQSLDGKLNYDNNRENISLTMLDAYITTFIKEGFFNSTCPFPNTWGILLSLCGSNTREQVIFTTGGIAIRHWESNTWSAWTIIN